MSETSFAANRFFERRRAEKLDLSLLTWVSDSHLVDRMADEAAVHDKEETDA